MPEAKKEQKKTKKPEPITIEQSQEHLNPEFCNYAHINVNHQDSEVLFNFIFVDRNLKNEKGELRGFSVGKIVMTKAHAERLNKTLGKILAGQTS